ncbi:MAG: glycosyltransferase family 2 protein [Bacillota bacterium]|nr:glycosyltransferase family 2 protein [Bacillota bacterium]
MKSEFTDAAARREEVTVSVVMPIYNESGYIDAAVESLLAQDYPRHEMEWIFVDGGSDDDTREQLWAQIDRFKRTDPGLIRLLNNPKRTVPYAMNIGIGAARGRYIVRLDAHAHYPSNYISACIAELEAHPEADNVGGFAETRGRGERGETIALMLASPFGVGNSQFRTGGSGGYVDTVPFGTFRRSVFRELGGYDTRLTRNQDNEMNYRIRAAGRKIWLSDRIRLTYWCRDTIRGINRMARQNGRWNVITMWLCPGSMGLRHFVPLAFLLSLLLLPLGALLSGLVGWGFGVKLFLGMLGLELALYLLLDLVAAIKTADGEWHRVPLLLLLFPSFHLNYGWGSLRGLVELRRFKRRVNKADYAPPL